MNAPVTGGAAAEPLRRDALFERARRLLLPSGGPIGPVPGEAVINPDFVPPQGFQMRPAAVLVGIVARETPSLLLTRRTAHLRRHAGQISFPGGTIDRDDENAEAAALREAEEEVGLSRRFAQPIGRLDPYIAGTGFHITPVVARIDPDHSLVLDANEVESAFEVPLAFLMAPENHRVGSNEWHGVRHFYYEMPYREHYIWGITAGIIRGLYERLFR